MAKIVELCGPPGVGKTTIYKEIESRWNKKFSWIPAHLLFPSATLSYEFLIKAFKNLNKIVKGQQDKVGTVAFLGARKRFVAQYPEYVDACWNDIMTKQKKSMNHLDLRFEKAQQLAEMIEKIQFLEESKTDKVAILEEGLIHLIDVLSFCNEKEDILRIIKVMPLPNAIIYIRTDVSENVRRLMDREQVINIHKLLNNHSLQQIAQQSHERRILINGILQNMDVPILHIDSKDKVESNADKIIAFVESLRE